MRRMVLIVLVVALAASGSAAAQSPQPSPIPSTSPAAIDLATLEALCAANAADETDLATCLDVVHRILVPGSGPSPTPAPSGYGADLPGIGVTQSAEDKDVTLVDVDWKAKAQYGDPAKGNRFVAIRVLYLATEDGASYNPFEWSAVDLDGFQHDQTFVGGKEPALSSSNDLPAGRKAQGWVTFEVPKSVHTLEVVASGGFGGDYLRWLVTEPK